jgi:hypothetical protein
MDLKQDVQKIKEIIDKSQEILVVTHEHPTFDSMGSALALYLGLVGLDKKVTIACPEPITVELSNFVGANKVVSEFGGKNFVVSLDYIEGSIEKVSYNIEGDKFNLVIEPRPGFAPFSADNVHYTHAGTSADVIFTIDTIHLGGLKKLYEANKELFAGKQIINIDRHPNNSLYGLINIVDSRVSTTAELTAHVLASLGTKLTPDIAMNLFNALLVASNNFQAPGVSAYSFDLASTCMKAGARRFGTPAPQTVNTPVNPPASAPVRPPVGSQPSVPVVPMQPNIVVPTPSPASRVSESQPQPVKPQEQTIASAAAVDVQTPVTEGQVKEVVSSPIEKPQVQDKQEAPADWLKPKIFKSSQN